MDRNRTFLLGLLEVGYNNLLILLRILIKLPGAIKLVHDGTGDELCSVSGAFSAIINDMTDTIARNGFR